MEEAHLAKRGSLVVGRGSLSMVQKGLSVFGLGGSKKNLVVKKTDADEDEDEDDGEVYEHELRPGTAKVVRVGESKSPAPFRWLRLKLMHYTDERGVKRQWECCERSSTLENVVDAVLVVTRIFKAGAEDQILLVTQFRPPVKAYVVELPAGLVDPNETEETAALRELKEETGYVGVATGKGPAMCSSAGMTSETVRFVHVDVDLDAEANKNPAQDLQDSEIIETHFVPRSQLLQNLDEPGRLSQAKKESIEVDARLYALALGMSLAA